MASPCLALQLSLDLPLPTAPGDGCLSLFLDSWESITRDQHVLHLLQHGLRISFDTQRIFTSNPVPISLSEARSKKEHLRSQSLLILERVANQFCPGFLQLALCYPPKKWEASVGHRPSVIEPSLGEGERLLGDACQSSAFHSEGRLGNLSGSDRYLPSCSDPPIIEEISSFLLPEQSFPVSCPAVKFVSEPKSFYSGSGCHDGPCSIPGCTNSLLYRRLAHEEPASVTPLVSNQCPPRLATRLGWIPSLEKSELTLTQDLVSIGTHYRTDLGPAKFKSVSANRKFDFMQIRSRVMPNILSSLYTLFY